MAEINSPLGKKVFSASAGHRRYQVEDASEFEQSSPPPRQEYAPSVDPRLQDFNSFEQPHLKQRSEEEDLIEQRRRMAMEMRNRLSPEAKKRLQILAGLGRITADVMIDNVKFSLRSLKTLEQEEVLNLAFKNVGASAITPQYRVRYYTLAHVVVSIDDQPLSHIIGSEDPDLKILIFEELGEEVTSYLWQQYQEKIVKKFQDKYAIKDEKDAKEVAKDIKK